MADSDPVRWTEPTWEWLVLLVLPAVYLVSALLLRAGMGPFWSWYALDPSYSYLLDSANLVNLTAPGHVADPGTPVQIIGALVLWVMHGFEGADAIVRAVVADPEVHLRAIGAVILGLNALALVAAGGAARLALGGMLPALMVQSGPFLSSDLMRRGLSVAPESLLIFVVLALAAVTLAAMRDDFLGERKREFAIAFGVVVGLGVATKVSVIPIAVLPVFLLGGIGPLAIYAAAAVVAFTVFTLPAAGAYGEFLSGVGPLATGGGHFAEGAPMVIDATNYPPYLARLLDQPALVVPVLLSLIALALAWNRRSRASAGQRLAIRALAGVVAALVLQAVVVARHAEARGLVSCLVLVGLMLALLYRVVGGLGLGSPRLRRYAWQTAAVLFSLFLVGRAVAMTRLDLEFDQWRTDAASIDDAAFRQCARIYFPVASDPVYALFLGNDVTRRKLTDWIARRAPADDFWFDEGTGRLRDAREPRDLLEVLAEYPCAFFRGRDRATLQSYLGENVPGLIVHDACSTREETVLTAGVDCKGQLTGR